MWSVIELVSWAGWQLTSLISGHEETCAQKAEED
jgi:hypothetical protein